MGWPSPKKRDLWPWHIYLPFGWQGFLAGANCWFPGISYANSRAWIPFLGYDNTGLAGNLSSWWWREIPAVTNFIWQISFTCHLKIPETSMQYFRCFNWMIPNFDVGNGCLAKHPCKTGCLDFQVDLSQLVTRSNFSFSNQLVGFNVYQWVPPWKPIYPLKNDGWKMKCFFNSIFWWCITVFSFNERRP